MRRPLGEVRYHPPKAGPTLSAPAASLPGCLGSKDGPLSEVALLGVPRPPASPICISARVDGRTPIPTPPRTSVSANRVLLLHAEADGTHGKTACPAEGERGRQLCPRATGQPGSDNTTARASASNVFFLLAIVHIFRLYYVRTFGLQRHVTVSRPSRGVRNSHPQIVEVQPCVCITTM